jgi:hypothetical protein
MDDELSGEKWGRKFPGSTKTKDLSGNFRLAVEDFLSAMKEAGIRVAINATYRPPQRSYLMHYAWRIARKQLDPKHIPKISGVNIEWDHGEIDASVKAAKAMLIVLQINNLPIKPALRSQHNSGLAIDMDVEWSGTVEVKDASGNMVKIATLPRTGINRQLIAIAATYGVKKYSGPGSDRPHWSNNGY